MNIFGQLAKHKVVEANNLNGLRNGHMVAQAKFDKKESGLDYLDNGHILALDNKGELVLAGAGESAYFLHYSEEHIKFLDSASLNMFTVPLDGDAYPRAIALYEGDTFTTDNYDAGSADVNYPAAGEYKGVTVVDGVLTLGAVAKGEPIAKAATLPSGQKAIQVTWKGGL